MMDIPEGICAEKVQKKVHFDDAEMVNVFVVVAHAYKIALPSNA
jgi:hypothetical protein